MSPSAAHREPGQPPVAAACSLWIQDTLLLCTKTTQSAHGEGANMAGGGGGGRYQGMTDAGQANMSLLSRVSIQLDTA